MNGTAGTPPRLGPIFVSVHEGAEALGLSRREVYRLMDADEIESVERGRRRLIVVESLHAYGQRLRDEAAAKRRTRTAA
ncbi:helix-turn-helix domain-containing protein [Micromonospora sp. NBC_01655]|uniref:helix-turn-helix domain-containing protein n=1 Tax=Micromonospora sp. NBC_01655 TaxID=2975983 RepID=UPI002B1CCE97|nr:helix-turn-helix domain-containing protein [Micromonospora sp. NBC_01655]